MSISAHPGKRLFPPYASNFKKDWKDTFFKVKGAPNCVVASSTANGEPKFPLSWTYTPAAVMGFDFDKMTKYDQGVVCFLEKILLSDIHELLDKEGDADDLDAYLRECFVIPVWYVLVLEISFMMLFFSLFFFCRSNEASHSC